MQDATSAAPAASSLTVVIVAYNSAEPLAGLLSSAATVLPTAELIVVDNGSTDETVGLATAHGARVLSGHGNVGFGAGMNLGVQAARRPLVLMLNPDTVLLELSEDDLALFRARRPGGLGACAMHDGRGRRYFDTRTDEPAWAQLEALLVRVFLLPRFVTIPWRRPSRRADWAAGSALLVNREEFLELGGFDDRFFMYYEDRELSARYRRSAGGVIPTEAVVVRHAGGESSAKDPSSMVAWALLSIIQYSSIRDGTSVAAALAARCLRRLVMLEALLRRFPGPVAARKAAQARNVAAILGGGADATDQHLAGRYPEARRAFERAGAGKG